VSASAAFTSTLQVIANLPQLTPQAAVWPHSTGLRDSPCLSAHKGTGIRRWARKHKKGIRWGGRPGKAAA
jgi:hypothetical protein